MQDAEILLSEKTSITFERFLSVLQQKKMYEHSHTEKYLFLKQSITVLSDQSEDDSSVSKFLVHVKTMNVHVGNTNVFDIRVLFVSDVV